MGLLQKLCETYDTFAHLAGKPAESGQEPLAPISHTVTRANIEICIDTKGNFRTARKLDEKEPKIVIPVTIASASRTSAPAPHMLCEQLSYLNPYNEQRYELYVTQLQKWVDSPYTHPKIQAVLCYVKQGTIIVDLQSCHVIEIDAQGQPLEQKLMVRWVIMDIESQTEQGTWQDADLIQLFIDYYATQLTALHTQICMISGEQEHIVDTHQSIMARYPNAKLISANDKTNFVYRGRFTQDWQAVTVGYISSQKAHAVLRWLGANQGVPVMYHEGAKPQEPDDTQNKQNSVFGNRTFLCWNPKGLPVPSPSGIMQGRRKQKEETCITPTAYQENLKQTLYGWKNKLPDDADIVIAVFDAATKGRASLTYYQELKASDFLERLHHWDTTCCFVNGMYGIQPPTLFAIIQCACGTLRGEKLHVEEEIIRKHMQRLMHCRIDKASFPTDIWKSIVEKASNLYLYPKKLRYQLLFTACAVIKKYHYDYKKEEYGMELDKTNTNRSYVFGRLLAMADIVERSTYNNDDTRETNALRMQKVFSQRPLQTWRVLEEKLQPYYRRLKPTQKAYYRRLVEKITALLSPNDTKLCEKLEDVYLLGYYHQRAYVYKSKNNDIEEQTEF